MNEWTKGIQAALSDRYRLERVIGEGGMSVVWLAESLSPRRQVALKVLKPQIAGLLGPDRFLLEIDVTARLSHPHILPLLESGEAQGILYYTAPYVAGESLRHRLEREKQLPVEEALRLAREIADALDYAHREGVIHRDIKPENILLQERHAVVADFGIARAMERAGGTRLTGSGMLIGTPAYMSPEQANMEADLDGRTDLYSLGCVLYEMLAGVSPYSGATAQSLASQHLNAPVPDVGTIRPSVSEGVRGMVRKLLAKSPADRFQRPSEVVETLDKWRDTPTPEASVPVPAPTPGRRLGMRVAVASVVAIAVAAGALWLRSHRPTPSTTNPSAVAVFPFQNQAGNDKALLSEGMVTLLSACLDGEGGLRSIDPHALIAIARRDRALFDRVSKSWSVDPGAARREAARLGAGMFVLGGVTELPSGLRLDASMYRTTQGEPFVSTHVQGSPDSLIRLVDDLAGRLLAESAARKTSRLAPLAARTTSSLTALKAFLEGEASIRDMHSSEGVAAYQRAVAADSSFALAWYRLSCWVPWGGARISGGPRLSRKAAERAFELSQGLPEHEKGLIGAWYASSHGETARAESTYRAIVNGYPEDIEAWHWLGTTLFFQNPLRGRSAVESKECFEHLLQFDPKNPSGLEMSAACAALEGHWPLVDSLSSILFEADPNRDYAVFHRTLLAFALDRPAELDTIAAILRATRGRDMTSVFREITPLTGRAEEVLAFGRSLEASPPSGWERTTGQGLRLRVQLANLEAACGRLRKAFAELDDIADQDPGGAFAMATLASLPFYPATREQLATTRRRLEQVDLRARPADWSVGRGQQAYLQAYLAGMISARLGDLDEALANAEQLKQVPFPENDSLIVEDLAHGVRACVALRQNGPAAALTELQHANMKLWLGPSNLFLFRQIERYLRAEALMALGHDEDALRWFATVPEDQSWHSAVFLAPCHLRRAQIYEKLGKRDDAIFHYRRFVEHWKNCDPELAPMVADARQRIARLTAQAG